MNTLGHEFQLKYYYNHTKINTTVQLYYSTFLLHQWLFRIVIKFIMFCSKLAILSP